MTASRGIKRPRGSIVTCTFPACDRDQRRNDLCDPHSLQLKRWGYLLPIGMKPRNPKQAKEHYSESYTAVHHRLRSWLGPASQYVCVSCGESAKDWSYNGKDTSPLIGDVRPGRSAEYSSDLTFYEPLCRGCHTKRDRYSS